jgi:hypothetical protein
MMAVAINQTRRITPEQGVFKEGRATETAGPTGSVPWSNPALSRQSGHNPSGTSGGRGFWQPGQTRFVSISFSDPLRLTVVTWRRAQSDAPYQTITFDSSGNVLSRHNELDMAGN